MRIVESYVAAKNGDALSCEDGIVVGTHFAAVVDGATDKSGRRFEGERGGRFVMRTLLAAVEALPAEADAYESVARLTAAVARRLPGGLAAADRPSAAATLYSAARHEVWQIGDVGFWYPQLGSLAPDPALRPAPGEDLPADPSAARKEVDRINVEMRAAVLRAELLRGATIEELAAHDPGREAIMPLLTRQVYFANNPAAGDLAYGTFDGRPVPEHLVRVVRLGPEVCELVIASDGYPRLFGTLSDSETHLKVLLAEDPLCIDELAGTKAVAPDHDSYDDRAYLRLEV